MTNTTLTLRPTRNDLPADVRAQVVTILQRRLAETVDAALLTKQAHWNVTGPGFRPLHELFDEVTTALHALADGFAERLVALGGVAHGAASHVAIASDLTRPDADSGDHVDAVSAVLAQLAASVRHGIAEAQATGDEATTDLLVGSVRDLDQLLWMVEAHAR